MFDLLQTDISTLPFTTVVPGTSLTSPIVLTPAGSATYVYFVVNTPTGNFFQPGDGIKIQAATLAAAFPKSFGHGSVVPILMGLSWADPSEGLLPATWITVPDINQKAYFGDGVYIPYPNTVDYPAFLFGARLAINTLQADISNADLVAMSPLLGTWQASIMLDIVHTRPLYTGTPVPPSGLSYSTNPATYLADGNPITPNTPTVSGTVTSYSVEGTPLPSGLSLDSGTGIVSGTPDAIGSGPTGYTIRATGPAGYTECELNITITTPP